MYRPEFRSQHATDTGNCIFTDNENGILTGNDKDTELDITHSEFGINGHGDGYGHNLYAGTLSRLSVTASYLHHARTRAPAQESRR